MSKTKIAVVTGANKGLGFAIVKRLCKEYNGKVYLTSRDQTKGLQACEELRALGLNPEYHQLDVTLLDSITNFKQGVAARNEVIDILVNNAGILFLPDSKESKYFQADMTVSVNFISVIALTEQLLPLLAEGARIVNISSSSGHASRVPCEYLRKRLCSDQLSYKELETTVLLYLETMRRCGVCPTWGDSPYVVSKVALNAYTMLLHKRVVKQGILVNCVHPGYVISDLSGGKGNISADDAAVLPAKLALHCDKGGQFLWHDGTSVPLDGPDPRGFIDGMLMQ